MAYCDLCSLRYSSYHCHYFHNVSLCCSTFPLTFFPDLHVGQKAIIPAQLFQYHHLQSHRPTLSPCEHPVEDGIPLASVPYLPYILQWLLVIIKTCSSKHFAIVSLQICPQAPLKHRIALNIDWCVKIRLRVLVSAIVSMFCNVCWRYHHFTAPMISLSKE